VTFLSTGGQASRSAAVEAGTTMGARLSLYTLQLKRKGSATSQIGTARLSVPPSIFVVKKDALQSKRKALKAMLLAMMEVSEQHKINKELSLQLIRKHLRLQNPEVIDAAYEDG